jgi:hypothetical protein
MLGSDGMIPEDERVNYCDHCGEIVFRNGKSGALDSISGWVGRIGEDSLR